MNTFIFENVVNSGDQRKPGRGAGSRVYGSPAFVIFAIIFVIFLGAMPATGEELRTDLRLGLVLEPPHLDPTAGAAEAIDEVVYGNVFEGLTRIGPDGDVLPLLATSWIISSQGRRYTFNLAEGARFHDGQPFDANVAVFSLNRARGEASLNAQKVRFDVIESVQALEPYVLQIVLNKPTPEFLFTLGLGDAVMVSPGHVQGNRARPIGTGPFEFDGWNRGVSLRLKAAKAYWGRRPALTSAKFFFISDPATAIAALLAGDVDGFSSFPAPEAIGQFTDRPDFSVRVGTTEGETILAMNHEHSALANRNVRLAIAHGINRQEIVDGAMFGFGTPIGSHFPPHHPDFIDLTEVTEFNPELAVKYLEAAKLPEAPSLRLHLPPPTYARRGGEIVAAQLERIGFKIELIPIEWAEWLDSVFRKRDFDLTIVSHTEPQDIEIYSRDSYYFNYKNDEFRATIGSMNSTSSDDERRELSQKAQRLLAEDVAAGFLFTLAHTGVWRTGIEGLWRNQPIQTNDLRDVRWVAVP